MQINQISGMVVNSAFKVHSALGPGLLESTYEACLLHELHKLNLKAESQLALPIVYDGVKLDAGYRLDILVEDSVIVELKAVEALLPIHQAQLMTYLKLSGKPVGLLMNFNVIHMKEGIKRIVSSSYNS